MAADRRAQPCTMMWDIPDELLQMDRVRNATGRSVDGWLQSNHFRVYNLGDSFRRGQ